MTYSPETKADIRRVLAGARCEGCFGKILETAANIGRFPGLEKQVQHEAQTRNQDENKAHADLVKHLDHALRAAKRIAHMEQPVDVRGLVLPPGVARVHALETMLNGLKTKAVDSAKGGRPRTLGNSHFAVALWGVLDRAKLAQRKRASVVRDCMVLFGVEATSVESAIKYARLWFKRKEPEDK